MSRIQKLIVLSGLIVVVAMGLYPPWVIIYQGSSIPKGYSFLSAPPHHFAQIDASQLMIQWLGVCIITTGLALIFRQRIERNLKKEAPETPVSTETIQCKNCGLINPKSAQQCDCGYSFVSEEVKPSQPSAAGTPAEAAEVKSAKKPALGGWTWLFIICSICGAGGVLDEVLKYPSHLGIGLSVLYIGLTIITCVLLLLKRPKAPDFAIWTQALTIFIGVGTLLFGVIHYDTLSGLIPTGPLSIAYAVAWLVYFIKSKRVSAIFRANR
jgi:hypothetical protein